MRSLRDLSGAALAELPMLVGLVGLAALAGLGACRATADGGEGATPSSPIVEAPAELDRYDVVWRSPSRDASGSMPIGNGEVGVNAWVEPGGGLALLVARTDAWSEASRLLKLGRVRVSIEPDPFGPSSDGGPFEQRLVLREGRIEISGGRPGERVALELFVDADEDVIHVRGTSERPVGVRASLECWRNERKRLVGKELESSWLMRGAPDSIEVFESADVIVDDARDVVWYHRNESSLRELTIAHQGLGPVAESVPDPLLGRTFGGRLASAELARLDGRTLASRTPLTHFSLALAAHADVVKDPDEWLRATEKSLARSPASAARARTAQWWRAFWGRSWIFVDGDPWPADDAAAGASPGASTDPRPPSRVTQAYLLQRWMQAAGGRGNYPIKFNGSIFTVEPRHAGGEDFDPDWRRWGDSYWWQNTRLAYHAMLAAGDFDAMEPLFAFYRELLPACRARAKLYYGAEGAYFPETITILGTYSNGDYGWEREGHAIGDVQCPWWQWAWNQGPELVALALDRFERTGDERFLERDLLPLARATLEWFDTRFARDADGKLVLSPAQSLETYWKDVVADLPTVAGLHEITERLAALPGRSMSDGDRALVRRVASSLPPIPVRVQDDGSSVLAPAASFDPARSNCENPELYALFPFRVARAGTPLFAAAQRAFDTRRERIANGWPQDGVQAALLGRVDEARDLLLAKARNHSPRFRFPAMWGPNFDWLPDQCHGANLMLTLQTMLLQEDALGRHVLPCFPAEWGVRFRLIARDGVPVEGERAAR